MNIGCLGIGIKCGERQIAKDKVVKIADVKLLVLEDPEAKGSGPLRASFLEVHTDGGIEDGHIAPPDGPGWGAQWDEERFRSLVVEEY